MQCVTESRWKSICEQVNKANKTEDESRVQETAQRSFTGNGDTVIEGLANVFLMDQANILALQITGLCHNYSILVV